MPHLRADDGRLSGHGTVVITGGNAGLGYQTALSLAGPGGGWHCVLACRNVKAGEEAAEALAKRSGRTGGTAEALHLDLASLASVRAFADRLAATAGARPPLRALVCNAGSQTVSGVTLTADGFETTFGVNHLGHFLLANLVAPLLVRPARMVFVSSGTHDPADWGSRAFGMNPPRLRPARQMAFPGEDPGPLPPTAQGRGREAYSTSKLCNLLTATEFARRLGAGGDAVTCNSFDPGLMPGTGLARDATRVQRFLWHYVLPALVRLVPGVRSPARSGRNLAWLIDDPALTGVTGRYFSSRRENTPSIQARDADAAARLWRESAELVSLECSVAPVAYRHGVTVMASANARRERGRGQDGVSS